MGLFRRIKFAYKVYRGLIPAIWRSWRAPAYPPPTREEVLEFMSNGFDGNPVPLAPTCRKLTAVEVARDHYFVGNPPDAIVQGVLDGMEADYRSSLKMHHSYSSPSNK
jgi:hypothetical protein